MHVYVYLYKSEVHIVNWTIHSLNGRSHENKTTVPKNTKTSGSIKLYLPMIGQSNKIHICSVSIVIFMVVS